MYIVPTGTPITPSVILAAVAQNERDRRRYLNLDDYYRGIHQIFKRHKVGSLKNNHVMINHAKYITRVNVGYLLGNPVDYQSGDDSSGNILDIVKEAYDRNVISDVDTEIATDCSKFGKAYEYVYAVGNDPHSRVLDPRNVSIIVDDTMDHNYLAAVIYSAPMDVAQAVATTTVNDREAALQRVFENIFVVDDTNITTYDRYVTNPISIEPHNFGAVPVIEYRNNPELEGDYEQVLSLIDAYNLLQSDRVNDKEQLVEAILMLYGFKLEKQQLKDLKTDRVMSVPAKAADAKAEYLVKQLQESSIEILKKSIEQDIHKISMTPNLSDENFVGNSSGVAIRYKLIAFEQNIMGKERYFKRGLLQRFTLYSNYLGKVKNADTTSFKINATFKRNLPQNDLETAQIVTALRNFLSDVTLASQVSFVDDAQAEIEQARQDALDRAQAMAEQFGTGQPNNPQDNTPQAPNADALPKVPQPHDTSPRKV